MDMTTTIVKPAEDVALLSLYDARLALNQVNSTSETLDEQIEMLVQWSSDEIATCCNRTFAQETVIETFREFRSDVRRLYVSHWPVSEVTSLTEAGTALVRDTDYVLDDERGVLKRLNALWKEPVVISYTGGYNLPFEAPPALRQAAVLLTREAYYAATRGDATVRMISHESSRIIYFDPMAKGGGAGGGVAVIAGSPARRTIDSILQCFIRIEA